MNWVRIHRFETHFPPKRETAVQLIWIILAGPGDAVQIYSVICKPFIRSGELVLQPLSIHRWVHILSKAGVCTAWCWLIYCANNMGEREGLLYVLVVREKNNEDYISQNRTMFNIKICIFMYLSTHDALRILSHYIC